MTFKDHFSGHARDYSTFRPGYPADLIDFVAALPRRRGTVWDVGTGSGQAAVALAGRFDRIVATDASAEQLGNAEAHLRVEYRVAPAEASGLPDASVDLVTVAQAFHWFDFDRFFAEVRRVLAPGGALAVWSYNLARIDPAVDRWIDELARDLLGPWWPPERRWVDEEYRTIPFPFPEVEAPRFEMKEEWSLERYLLYVRTWSAFKRYEAATGRDPIAETLPEIETAWGGMQTVRTVVYPVFLRASRPIDRP